MKRSAMMGSVATALGVAVGRKAVGSRGWMGAGGRDAAQLSRWIHERGDAQETRSSGKEGQILRRNPSAIWGNSDENGGASPWVRRMSSFSHSLKGADSKEVMTPRLFVFHLKQLASERDEGGRRERLALLEDAATPMVHQFRSVQIAVVFASYGKMGLAPGGAMIRALEEQALQVVHELDAVCIADMFWGYSRMRLVPTASLLEVMERLAASKMAEFSAHNITKLFMGYAMLQLEQRVTFLDKLESHVSLCFKDLSMADIICLMRAITIMGRPPQTGVLEPLCHSVLSHLQRKEHFPDWAYGHLQIFLITSETSGWLSANGEVVDAIRGHMGQRGFKALYLEDQQRPRAPHLLQVASVLREFGHTCELGYVNTRCGYALDIMIRGNSKGGGAVAVEVVAQGVDSSDPDLRVKRRALQLMGYTNVLICADAWEKAGGATAGYIKRLMESAGVESRRAPADEEPACWKQSAREEKRSGVLLPLESRSTVRLDGARPKTVAGHGDAAAAEEEGNVAEEEEGNKVPPDGEGLMALTKSELCAKLTQLTRLKTPMSLRKADIVERLLASQANAGLMALTKSELCAKLTQLTGLKTPMSLRKADIVERLIASQANASKLPLKTLKDTLGRKKKIS